MQIRVQKVQIRASEKCEYDRHRIKKFSNVAINS